MVSHKVYLYNSLTKSKEEFSPIVSDNVGMYTCGPTVYHFAHIGNLRTFVFNDLLRRMLSYFGYNVNHVMNITDVGHLTDDGDSGEDKMLKGAKREGKTVWDVAKFYTDAFLKDCSSLNLLPASVLCKATDHIDSQISMIQELEKNGLTYFAGGNVYFDTSKLFDYGALVGLDVKKVSEAQARVDGDSNKKNPTDFVLWFTKSKFDDQAMKWDSPWGVGYPGWHIECSAMASEYLGKQFDIHTGGMDLAPVHHINEIAQAEGAYGCSPWVNHWMHGEFLVLGKNEKMSKSSGNFLSLSSLEEKGFSGLDYRYFLLSGHYRKPLTFNFEALEGAKVARRRLMEKVWSLKESWAGADFASIGRENISEVGSSYLTSFETAISDDLNMPRATAVIWDLLKDNDLSDNEKYVLLMHFDSVFGLDLGADRETVVVPEEIMALADARWEAKKAKDWGTADKLRDQVREAGFEIVDGSDGFEVVKGQ